MRFRHRITGAVAALGVMATVGVAAASSHREAPAIATDPSADNTDVWAWVTPGTHDKLYVVAAYNPLEEPSGGPNFHKFSDDVLYAVHIARGDQSSDLATAFKARIEQPLVVELGDCGPVIIEMPALPPHRLLPGDAEPGKVLIDCIFVLRARPGFVDVLDAQQQPATQIACHLRVKQCRVGMAQMQKSIRARRKTQVSGVRAHILHARSKRYRRSTAACRFRREKSTETCKMADKRAAAGDIRGDIRSDIICNDIVSRTMAAPSIQLPEMDRREPALAETASRQQESL